MAWSPRDENSYGRNGGQCMLDRSAKHWLDCNASICPYYHPRLDAPAYAQWQARKREPQAPAARRQVAKRLNREAPAPSAEALAMAAFSQHAAGVADAGRSTLAALLADQPLPTLLERFRGGSVSVVGDATTLRELPIEAVFARLALLRNALQALELALDESTLDADTKDKGKRDLAGIGGSMTTFNLLFHHKPETFKGTGKADT
jgi:hypothetical protein